MKLSYNDKPFQMHSSNILREVTNKSKRINKVYKFKNTFKNNKKLELKKERRFLSTIEKENVQIDENNILDLNFQNDTNSEKTTNNFNKLFSKENQYNMQLSSNDKNEIINSKAKSLQFDDFVQPPKSTSTPKVEFNPLNLNNVFTPTNSNLLINTSSNLHYEISQSHLKIRQLKQKNFNKIILDSPLFDKDKKFQNELKSSITSNITFNGDSTSINATYFYSNK